MRTVASVAGAFFSLMGDAVMDPESEVADDTAAAHGAVHIPQLSLDYLPRCCWYCMTPLVIFVYGHRY